MRIWAGASLLLLSVAAHADLAGEKATRGLIDRIIPKHSKQIVLESIPKDPKGDVFEVDSRDGKVVLRGNNGVSLASALNWYLKYTCNCQLSWGGDQLVLPATLPPPQKERRVGPYNFRYNFNYCTFNYSMSWWDWKRWEREIDFMALNGINMPLAITGQEAVWQRVYRKMGFTDAELSKFFCGPAYFAWFWMGNLDAWGGPLPQSWFDSHAKLQQQILKREREFGMTPVLPAFTGHVPPTFANKYPAAKTKKINWGLDFADTLVLDPTDPLFPKIGEAFLKEQEAMYGSDHYYSADTFNENRPPTTDPVYLGQVSKGIYDTMAKIDPKAVWVMQGWIFFNDQAYWKDPQIEALLTAVPQGRLIVLDLFSDVSPQWKRTKSYHGQPWIWCFLHNFGGRMNLFGSLENTAKAPTETRLDPTSGNLQGIGFTPEAIENNPVIYELMGENAWRSEPVDVQDWIKGYAHRRYGKVDPRTERAWELLAEKVYNDRSGADNAETSIVASRPTLSASGHWVGTSRNYDPKDMLEIWRLMVEAAPSFKGVDTFEYDLVDITRQALADIANAKQQEFMDYVEDKDLPKIKLARKDFLGLIADWDKVMGTRKEFLLGKWIADARKWGTNTSEKNLMEQNARDLLTLWGGRDSGLTEYSTRLWSGLLNGYYAMRWGMFFDRLESDLAAGKPVDAARFAKEVRDREWEWVNKIGSYPSKTSGNSIDEATKAYKKYSPSAAALFPTPPPLGLEQGAKATSSSVQAGHGPEAVIDGSVTLGSAWWGSPYPQWVQLELKQVETIKVVHIWPYWGGGRYYQYTVQVSEDGQTWKTVVDRSTNQKLARPKGDRVEIPATKAKFIRVNMLKNSANEGVHLVEIRLY